MYISMQKYYRICKFEGKSFVVSYQILLDNGVSMAWKIYLLCPLTVEEYEQLNYACINYVGQSLPETL